MFKAMTLTVYPFKGPDGKESDKDKQVRWRLAMDDEVHEGTWVIPTDFFESEFDRIMHHVQRSVRETVKRRRKALERAKLTAGK